MLADIDENTLFFTFRFCLLGFVDCGPSYVSRLTSN